MATDIVIWEFGPLRTSQAIDLMILKVTRLEFLMTRCTTEYMKSKTCRHSPKLPEPSAQRMWSSPAQAAPQ